MPAFEEIPPEREIFLLRLAAQVFVRLARIVHRGDAGVPGHVPGRHVPKHYRARLQSGGFTEKEEHAAPLGPFPGNVRLDESNVRDQRTKAAQRGEKTELADLFAQIESELGLMKIGAAMLLAETRPRSADARAPKTSEERK